MDGQRHDAFDMGMFAPLFGDMGGNDAEALFSKMTQKAVARGTVLIKEGEPATNLYLVVSGRFEVRRAGSDTVLAEVGVGQPIGEIAFFTGETRTADVVAARDSRVLSLDRSSYDALAEANHRLPAMIVSVLAKRLAETSSRISEARKLPSNETVTLVPLSSSSRVEAFSKRYSELEQRTVNAVHLTRENVDGVLGVQSSSCDNLSDRLNGLEMHYDRVSYFADPIDDHWSQTAIRQADQVLLVADAGDTTELRQIEKMVAETHRPSHIRLILIHQQRQKVTTGTPAWLAPRSIFMHHHVSLEDDADIYRLLRFLKGTATGFVCGGGNAFGAAHLGVFEAFQTRGITFDMLGGTSVGAAMAGALAAGNSAYEIDVGCEDMFVQSKVFKRPTLPRYSLIDHEGFDNALKKHYGEDLIEDLWLPYFAIATNLSENRIYMIRTGKVWESIRASAALPGVLPPFFTKDGDMLVDGGITDNIPVQPMHSRKTGPNVVVNFARPIPKKYVVDYHALPGRNGQIKSLLNPLAKRPPKAPGIVNVILRSLLANQRYDDLPVGAEDLVVRPTIPKGMSFMDWEQHTPLYESARAETLETIDQMRTSGDPLIAGLDKAMDAERPVPAH